MKERLKELLKMTENYCPGINKRFIVDTNRGKMQASFYLTEIDRKNELEKVIGQFDDILSRSDIYKSYPYGLVENHIALSRYEDITQYVIDDLKRIIQDASNRQGKDPIYCLSIWLDPEQGGFDYNLNCENAFKTSLNDKRAGIHAEFYQSEEDIERYRFYSHTELHYEVSDTLSDLLGENAERHYQTYCDFGDPYINRLGSNHFELMTDSVARAIRQSIPLMNEKLITTEYFIAYIRYYDQDEVTHYRAMRKTVSLKNIKMNCKNLYKQFY